MSKHVLALRLGHADETPISVGVDEKLTEVNFIAANHRLDHGVGNAVEELNRFGVYPTELALDLYLLASLVFAADTRISRTTESQDEWTREIRLVLPVSDPERWLAAQELTVELLNFLTGDRWDVTFRARPEGLERLLKVGEPKGGFSGVSLFSGGLDSLIGSIDELSSGRKPLLVSHAGDGATSTAQRECMDGLTKAYGSDVVKHLRVWLQFDKHLIKGVPSEDSTRSRSFLFIAAAVLAASGIGPSTAIRVPENGLIALNIPLDSNRLGALSTRTTHPYYLARWRDLANHLSLPSDIHNPYWDKTKGEMAAECRQPQLLQALVTSSLSCASPTKGRWLGLGTQHCGYCLPCLIRRASLLKALGSGGDPTVYTLQELATSPISTRSSQGQQIRSLQLAIHRLEANPVLARMLILKSGPLAEFSGSQAQLADVYLRGMTEVGELLRGVETRPL